MFVLSPRILIDFGVTLVERRLLCGADAAKGAVSSHSGTRVFARPAPRNDGGVVVSSLYHPAPAAAS